MRHYFAYGSNMLRSRLEARVGPVRVVGAGVLDGYCHAFTKLGTDGTGKGNIAPAPGNVVHGVVYTLSLAQLALLDTFEDGYRQVVLPVRIPDPVNARVLEAVAYEALSPVPPLRPADHYLAYYELGMREHSLPADYVALVLGQART